MRLLLAGGIATLTAAGLATIPTAVLTDEERSAALVIRAEGMRADARFLARGLVDGPGSPAGPVAREYLAARFEAMGLEPGAPGRSWQQAFSTRSAANVIARLSGRDPALREEAVLYSAHDGDPTGLATMLAVAEAFAALPSRPRRSVLFAAAVAEGPGLPAPPGRLAAHLDIDGSSIQGSTRDVPVAGLGTSSLDGWLRAVAEAQGRVVAPVPFPDGGGGSRSEPVSFARVGVPAVLLDAGAHHRSPGGPTGERDVAGTVEGARLLFHVGLKVAETR